MKQKRFKIEYKDSIDMRCIQIVYAKSEKKEDTVFVDNKSPEWTLEDGTPLGKNFQEALNDAMSTYTNSDGLTLEQAMELASQNKNK